jgi:hypothetical protein
LIEKYLQFVSFAAAYGALKFDLLKFRKFEAERIYSSEVKASFDSLSGLTSTSAVAADVAKEITSEFVKKWDIETPGSLMDQHVVSFAQRVFDPLDQSTIYLIAEAEKVHLDLRLDGCTATLGPSVVILQIINGELF